MASHPPSRWIPLGLAAVAIALALWAVIGRLMKPAIVEVPVSPVTGPAPVSAWQPGTPATAGTGSLAARSPSAPDTPADPSDTRKKVLTQEEIESGKW